MYYCTAQKHITGLSLTEILKSEYMRYLCEIVKGEYLIMPLHLISEYLVHAGCYQNLSADYRMCADNYLHQQETAKKAEMKVQDRLRKSCW